MDDSMGKPTRRGLRSPANDGAPRPKPPRPTEYEQTHPAEMFSGYNQTPEMLAAEDAANEHVIHKRGELDGLRKAVRAMCTECRAGHVPQLQETHLGDWWFHEDDPNASCRNDCEASPIHDVIAQTVKAGT